jgi:Ca2+-binding RTX toxin-like protein
VAFTTIRGESGVDFIGSDGVDVLFALNETGALTVDAKAGNDNIVIATANAASVTSDLSVTVKGGEGNDTITAQDLYDAGVARFTGADVKGGAGNDTFNTGGAVTSVLRGNEGNDGFALEGNYTNSTLNGNSGSDSFVTTAAIALSNVKVLGGTGNDGAMDFDLGIATDITVAVESTINGGKGVDNISIGDVAVASNFFVFGGQDNDVITSTNDAADGVTFSGDKGDDTLNLGDSDDIANGGEGNDLIAAGGGKDTVDAGAGNDIVTDGAGADSNTLGAGNDSYTDGAGSDTIIGGAGHDTYTFGTADLNHFDIDSVTDSAAAMSGTSVTFDDLDSAGGSFDLTFNTIDITGISDSLTGASGANALNIVALGANITTCDTFADLRTHFAGGAILPRSGATAKTVEATVITVAQATATAANIDGTYIILNNGNTILDGGDVMFEINLADFGAGEYAFTTSEATSAWLV